MSKPTPKPGILDISPYVAGKSSAGGAGRILKLSSNESALGPSPKAVEAYRAMEPKLHRYPDVSAIHLREAIAEVQKLPVEQLICGAGSDELIGLLVHAYAGRGDEVLYSEHGFLMYEIYARGNGALPVKAPEKNLTADVDALLAAVTPRTKIVFLANPNNPTGSYLPAGEVKRLREGLPEHIILALDGAYSEYVTAADYTDGRELVEAGENTVMLRTFSKIYGLPGLRIGWGYCPAPIIDVLNRIRGPFNVSSPAIYAAAAAMRDVAYTHKAIAHNTQWLNWLSTEMQSLGLKPCPSTGNFLLVGFPETGTHTAAAANKHLLAQGIIVREVTNYGLPHHLRITIGTEEEMRAVAAGLKSFLSSRT